MEYYFDKIGYEPKDGTKIDNMTPKVFEATNFNSSTNDLLQLSPIQINNEYRNEWNVREKDFVVLTKNGKLISNSLYRVGGFGADINERYFMLIKYVEAFWTAEEIDFLKKCYPNKSCKELQSERKYLKGLWCILDRNGVEKKVFEDSHSPYLVKDSCIYANNQNYFNIETGEFYCRAYSSIQSKEFLFLDTPYDEDKTKCGVMKINKKDGSFELFN